MKMASAKKVTKKVAAKPKAVAKKAPAKKAVAKSPAKKVAAKKAPAKSPAKKKGADTGGVTFRDWGFRLVVLETLYDLGHFHDEFERAGELAADAEEYTVSKPARDVLDAIALTPELLATITAISLDVGAVQHVLTSEWDGEDDLFEVKRVEDAALLPNLEEITVISNIAQGTNLAPLAKVPKLRSFRCTIGGHWAKGLEAFEPLMTRGVMVTLSS